MAIKFNHFHWRTLILLLSIYVQNVTSLWEYAICTKQNIIFYDNNWNEVAEATSKNFENLKAITYDTTHDLFYFIDRHINSTFINSLKLRNDGTWITKTLMELNEKEWIEDIAYDFNDDILFMSDKQSILKFNFDRTDPDRVILHKAIFLNITNGSPAGIELDACKRMLYYTVISSDSTINAISIKEMKNEIICKNCEKYRPNAIAIDEKTDRLYIADKKSNVYYINSFTSDDDFRQELKSMDRTPRSIAVDHEYVYYVDGKEHSLRRLLKHHEHDEKSEFMIKFKQDPMDIIVRSNFIDAINVDLTKCDLSHERMTELQSTLEKVRNDEIVCQKSSLNKPKETCLHGGSYDKDTSLCVCKDARYDGDNCEIDLCYNFCMNGGECSMESIKLSTRPMPTCSCTKGFKGDRCEIDICTGYCLNDGICSIDNMKRAVCKCINSFGGSRCESSQHGEEQPVDTLATFKVATAKGQPDDDINIQKCPVRLNLTYIIIAICLTLSLLFVLIIMLVIVRVHKRPIRPKIRKKYVVHKNIEPLTCRPTTEQCEVIIEDCCNMNICETPCFDPKILQQDINEKNIRVKLTTSKKCSSKEDKQDLLNNMEHNQ